MKKSVINPSSLHKIIPQEKFPSLTVDPETLLAFPHGVADKKSHQKWKERPVLESDLGILYDKIFGNPHVMKTCESGIPLSREELYKQFQGWNQSLQDGHPKGAFLIANEQDECIDYVLIDETDQPGVAEIEQAYNLQYASQGMATSVIRCFIEKWAPHVSRLGREPSLKNQFRCFQGAHLQKFYGYIRPSNPGAWISVDRLGFQGAQTSSPYKQNVILNYYNPKVSRSNKAEFLQKLAEMEDHILEYFKKNMDLEKDEKILMVDLEGNERTVGYLKAFQNIWWHFEYALN